MKAQSTISVALCTYNGEKYLAEQLASIQRQTRLPDELVVCDDRSADRTVDIVREVASASRFPVRIFVNEKNLGPAKNFEKAIQVCSGNLIALSDQDDIWYPIRLERSEQELQKSPEAGLVFSDGDIIDDQDRPTGRRLWQNFGFQGRRRRRFLEGQLDLLVKYRFVTGATVMFRAELRNRLLPVGSGWMHDEWLAATMPAVADLRSIDEPLIRYRRHSGQKLGLGVGSSSGPATAYWGMLSDTQKAKEHWSKITKQIGELQTVCDRLSAQDLDARGYALLNSYQARLRFLCFRAALPKSRLTRLLLLPNQYSAYAGHAAGLLSMATDLVLSKFVEQGAR